MKNGNVHALKNFTLTDSLLAGCWFLASAWYITVPVGLCSCLTSVPSQNLGFSLLRVIYE